MNRIGTVFNMENGTDISSFCTTENTYPLFLVPESASHWLWSNTDRFFILIVIPIVAFLGIFGNTCFLLTIFRLERMRNSLNVYMCNLAVADALLLASTCAWYLSFFLHSDIIPNVPVKSLAGCIGLVFSSHQWYYASLGFITLTSVERYFAICRPLQRLQVKGKARTAKLCIAVWVTSLVLTAPYIPRYMHFENCIIWPKTDQFADLPTRFHQCAALNDLATSVHVVEAVPFLIILIVNIILYTLIIVNLSSRSIAENNMRTTKNNGVRNQVARTIILNGIIFFFCQVISRVASLDKFLNDVFDVKLMPSLKHYTVLLTIGRCLLLVNSCINPYFYIATCRHYRHAMRDALKLFVPCLEHKNRAKTAEISLSDRDQTASSTAVSL